MSKVSKSKAEIRTGKEDKDPQRYNCHVCRIYFLSEKELWHHVNSIHEYKLESVQTCKSVTNNYILPAT